MNLKDFIKSPTKTKFVLIRNKYFQISRLKAESKNIVNIPKYTSKENFSFCNEPKVSIMMPIYNHASVAKQAIDSIVNQTYKNIEIIILDDGSTDDLYTVLKKYKNDDRIKFYKQKNQKLPRALTHLHQLATGDFLTWTSADNVLSKNMIKILVNELLKHPEASLVYGDVTVIGANNKPYYKICRDVNRDRNTLKIIRLLQNDMPLSLDCDNYINACFLYRKSASDALIGKYSDEIIGAEDYDFWLRLQKSGKLYHIDINTPLYFYRVHDNTMSHELETKKIKIHQSRLLNLMEYENRRKQWVNIRPYLDVSDNFKDNIHSELKHTIEQLAVDSNLLIPYLSKHSKIINIVPESSTCDSNIYIELSNDFYYLKDKLKNNPITSFYYGLDVSPLSFKARNNMSRTYYVDALFNAKCPVYGSYINSSNIDITFLKNIIVKNSNIKFVLLDSIHSDILDKLSKDELANNLVYYDNCILGNDYKIYSNLSKMIIFPEKNGSCSYNNIFSNLLLAYAIGRSVCYFNSVNVCSVLKRFPYTSMLKFDTIDFKNDSFSRNDYKTMDKYLYSYSKVGCLKKIIDYYNTYTQDICVEKPKYDIEFIPEESAPVEINFNN